MKTQSQTSHGDAGCQLSLNIQIGAGGGLELVFDGGGDCLAIIAAADLIRAVAQSEFPDDLVPLTQWLSVARKAVKRNGVQVLVLESEANLFA